MQRCTCAQAIRLGAAILIVATGRGAHAQGAGDNTLSVGWVHSAPQTGSDPLRITSIGGTAVDTTLSGSGAGARSSDTAGFTIEHYFTDHIGVSVLGGWPGRTRLEGRGSLESYGVLGDAHTWAPEVVLRYHFGLPQSRFRPFAGLGVNYTWFSNARVTNSSFVTQNFGPGGSASVSASSSWSPVFQAGFDYRISKHWAAGMSVTYVPTDTNVTLTGRTAAGTEIVSKTKVRLRPLMTFLNVSYTF
ncbi:MULTISPECIES: OmpW/AlkL family protein [Burkholderia]|nr:MULTISPECIES: OmpW family outer membrane protein [Burkholderia]RQS24187.1 OmpW family protein [Burkholderia sp. Bp8995]RQS38916.1 OmpW family protein [Burkholderia sp. Bp8989]